MTSSSNIINKKFSEAEKALSDVSLLLSSLCKSRKAAMRLPQIIELTGVVARLARALKLESCTHGGCRVRKDYGDSEHYKKISAASECRDFIR